MARCKCGHDREEHLDRLPAPCRSGWSLTLQVEAMEQAREEGQCPLKALAEETERQRATGKVCECIAFSQAGNDRAR